MSSILDQLFPDIDIDRNPVEVRQMGPEDWVISTTAFAVHQTMRNGFDPGKSLVRGVLDTALERPQYDIDGTVDVGKSLELALNYRKILVRSQIGDIRYQPTSDFVLDGGIKNGSKVVIRVIPQSESRFTSWDSLARARVSNEGGKPKDLTFDKFSVLSLTEPDEQRYQIHQTFGADIIQTFGRRPRILTLTGQVLNGKIDVSVQGEIRSMDWKNAFQRFYDDWFSAHACTKKNNKVRIFSQDTVYEGYMLNMVSATSAMDQGISQVTITFVLSSRTFPRENDALIPGAIDTDTGFRITGKRVPDEFFPQAQIEHYFRDDVSSVPGVEAFRIEKELDEVLEALTQLDGRLFQLELENSLDTVYAIYKADPEEFDEFNVTAPGFRTHILFSLESAIVRAIEDYGKKRDELDQDIEVYNNEQGYGQSSEIIPSSSADFDELKKREGELRIQKRGLQELNNRANTLAQKALELKIELELWKETEI